jgi:type I restriction enzyme M protein
MSSAASNLVNKVWNYCNLLRDDDIYEGLLEKNAQDTKSGRGPVLHSRVLIDAIVEVMRPQPGATIIDPAAGTGGFLLSAASHIQKSRRLDRLACSGP